jgi:glycosyltransferase involved in cell wall biosynthesis
MQPILAFVVTCKGRLHHLRQSLVRIARQPNTECIVVDYDCPDRARDWVAQNYPAIKVVHVANAPLFNVSHARNIGAQAAMAPWLCFVDADNLLDDGFAETVTPLLGTGKYFRPSGLPFDTYGAVVCPRTVFCAVGGYDEAIEDWGGEDDDLYFRFDRAGLKLETFPRQLVAAIEHDDAERTANFAVRDKWLGQRIASLYLHIKYDLERQIGPNALSLDSRRGLYGEIRGTLLRDFQNGSEVSSIEVTLPDRLDVRLQSGWMIHRRWSYRLEPEPTAPQARAQQD